MRVHNRLLLTFVVLLAVSTWRARSAHAETPSAICAQVGTDDTLRPIPASLVPAINKMLGTEMPDKMAMDTTVFRCAKRHVLVCTTGANLPCGRANTGRTPSPGAVDWCRDHSGTALIPAVATGHDTTFAWRCQGGTPQIDRQVLEVDTRGFVSRYWKMLR
jgi:hypothetical protein